MKRQPTKLELEHATRYADEVTKLYLYEEYRKRYKDIFENHAFVVTRPADSSKDYYVPDSIKDKCIVVSETRFDETGCRRLACFPFKNHKLEPCSEPDDPRWLGIGKSFYTLACQPTCFRDGFRYRIDTDWISETCYEANPFKKMFAMNPEKIFDTSLKDHGGLEWNNGQVILTKEYCEAYGLDFDGRDCFLSNHQSVGEFFLGKTIYRNIRLQVHSTGRIVRDPRPPRIRKSYFYENPEKRTSRNPELNLEPETVDQLSSQIVAEISADIGIDIATSVVKNILKKRVPKLVERASRDLIVRHAVKQAVVRSAIRSMAIKMSIAAGKSIGVASNILMAVGMIGMVLDILDPADYDKVLSETNLSKIVRRLDAKYYGHENPFRIVTPEFVWDHVLKSEDGNDSKRYEYMSDKIKEYLEALYEEPPENQKTGELPKLSYFKWKKKQSNENLNLYIILFLLVCCMLIFEKWIHVWAFAQVLTLIFFSRK